MNPHEQDPERPLGWLLRPLLRVAFPEPARQRPALTPEVVAFRLVEPDEFAVEAALLRGWCTDTEADRWALHVGRFPWEVWPSWLAAGLHPIDRFWSLDEAWRPAWLAALEARERAEPLPVAVRPSRPRPCVRLDRVCKRHHRPWPCRSVAA